MDMTLAQSNAAGIGLMLGILIFVFALLIIVIAGMWKVYTKAGQPGWAVIIPFYNQYIQCKIVGRPGWWLILLLIPYVGIIFYIIIMLDLARSFGKGVGFGIGLILLSPIFVCILGFGDAEYQGPSAA